jgi:hypothetical protein
MQRNVFPQAQRENFLKLLEKDLAKTQDEETISADESFLRVCLEYLGFDVDHGYLTDGKSDHGFDFVEVTEREATIFQAKSFEFDGVIESQRIIGGDYLTDLRQILDVCKDLEKLPSKANAKLKEALQALRTEIGRALIARKQATSPAANDTNGADEPIYTISIRLVVLAKGFTPQAENELSAIENTDHFLFGGARVRVSIYPYFIDDLLEENWRRQNTKWRDKGGKEKNQIDLTVVGDVIRDRKSLVFFTRANDLVRAYEDLGYQIFEPNVRAEIRESAVNKEIRKTITTPKGRSEFKHLNNGITIICKGVTTKGSKNSPTGFSARYPGIVNGLQTVKSLYDGFSSLETPEAQQDFVENCHVLCRLHEEGAVKQIANLIKATNNQNPMRPRNLRSNDPEQIAYERMFADLGWFYERKEGAWRAFRDDPDRWPGMAGKGKSAFITPSGKERRVDNDNLAQAWLAFIGFATEAINEKRSIFQDDDYYNLIFLTRTIKHGFDYDFKPKNEKLNSEAVNRSPSAAAFLLSFLCRESADCLVPSRSENRLLALKRHGIDPEDTSKDEQDKTLDQDEVYIKGRLVRGMLTLFGEFVGFILFRSLGEGLHDKAIKVLNSGSLKAAFKDLKFETMRENWTNDKIPANDLILMYFGAFDHCATALIMDGSWMRGYNDAPVKNKYIYSIRTRQHLLNELLELDKKVARTEHTRAWADGFNSAKGVFAFTKAILS